AGWPWMQASSLAIQSDGRIVVAGETWDEQGDVDFALARYLSDGGLDPTFGSNGTVTTSMPGENWARHVLVQPNGRILVAGESWQTYVGDEYVSLVRYTRTGDLDPTFGARGVVHGAPGEGGAVTLQRDGKILAG